MSNTVLPIRAQLARGSFTTGCACATVGVLVCGSVAPSIEASGVRSEVRAVQLASLNGPTANPLGVLVGTLPAAAAAAATAAPVAPLPTGVSTDVQPLVESQSADVSAEVPEASDGGMTVGQWVVMTVIQSVAAIGRLFPENDPIRAFFAAFVLLGTFVGLGVVAPFIDSVVNLVLWPFGLGTAAAAPLAAVGPIESNGETSTSDTVETADRVNGDIAKFAEPEPGSEKAASPVGTESADVPTDPEATLSEQVSAEGTEPTEATAAVDVVEVEPAAAEEVATEPEAAVGEVATDTVDPAADVTEAAEPEAESSEPETTTETETTEAESTTAQDESTAEAGDQDGPSDNTAAEDSSSAPASKGSESSGDTAE